MHFNYYFLQQLTQELAALITPGVVSECFSQNKEELVLRIEIRDRSFFIKAALQPSFSCLSFPATFNRARKNSIDLFPECIGRQVMGIRQFENERSFALLLSDDYQLVFKLHGNRSNILLFHSKKVVSLFRKNIVADVTLDIDTMDRSIDWSESAFQARLHQLTAHYFTFGKVVWSALKQQGFFDWDPTRQWQTIRETKTHLENPSFFIVVENDTVLLSLLPVGEIIKKETSPIAAINFFYYEYLQRSSFNREKSHEFNRLTKIISAAENYIAKTKAKLQEVETDRHYKVWADVLMASLHVVKAGVEKVELLDFYSNKPIEIKLKRELSAQKNAEVFYRKAKNQEIEIVSLQKAIAQKEAEKAAAALALQRLNEISSLKELRTNTEKQQQQNSKKEIAHQLPYHEFIHHGFAIWVGKNAQANDQLTLKHSYREDLWLHAKDVPGSHVLIKYQAGKAFPADVIERAAQLAAYNSKRKNEALTPVIYTPKKYVRKRKGDPAGAVIVEKEKVLLVEPRLEAGG